MLNGCAAIDHRRGVFMAQNAALRGGMARRYREDVQVGSADACGVHFQKYVVVFLNLRDGVRFETPLAGRTKHQSFHGLRHFVSS